MDKWENLSTINEIIKFCEDNPQYKKFLDKQLTISVRNDEEEAIWNNKPQVRFSEDHDELIIE